MTAPEILDTASPYWLRLYGHWVHLQGIMPVNDVTSQRRYSELVTVDGYRYAQRAPRGPRTWELPYRYGTAAATAALESAAYDLNTNDPVTRTLFLDTNAARVNMVDPDLLAKWGQPGGSVLNVGESADKPIWLPSYNVDTTLPDRELYIPVRPGVTYSLALWAAGVGATANAITVTLNTPPGVPGDQVLVTYNYPGPTAPATNPDLVNFTFTPPAVGVVTIRFADLFLRSTAGLMVYEGDCPPDYYRAGRRMPCQVSVQDPAVTTNLIWSAKCPPCGLPREHASFTIQEVGLGLTDASAVA